MKALVLRKHGALEDLEVLNDYPMPQAVEGHVVIRVGASSFNYHDYFTVKGMPGIKVPLPVIIEACRSRTFGQAAKVAPAPQPPPLTSEVWVPTLRPWVLVEATVMVS